MTAQSDAVEESLPQTLRQVTDDAQRLNGTLKNLAEGLQQKGLQLSPELEITLLRIRQGLDKARKQSDDLVKQSTRLQELVRASALISTSLELDEVLAQVMDAVISLSGAERAYLVLREGGELHIRQARNWYGETLAEADAAFSHSIVQEAFNTAEPILTMNAQNDLRFNQNKSVIGQALRSILCIPLAVERQVVGVLYADNRVRSGLFTKEQVQILSAFGIQAAIAIEKARLHGEEIRRQRLEKELSVARDIQFSLLPKTCPTVEGWDFSAVYQPARLVGGDLYDFFELPGDLPRLGVVIADVADKGVAAAMFVGLSRTMIRSTALSGGPPATALAQANELILQDSSRSNLFLSAFYAVLETQSGHLTYSSAGHNHPLCYRAASGTIDKLSGKGIVLGLFENIQLSQHEIDTQPGDLLIFYTDGVTEAMDPKGREFGEDRLQKVISATADGSAQQVLDAIIYAIKTFTRDAPQSDDVTLVVVKKLI